MSGDHTSVLLSLRDLGVHPGRHQGRQRGDPPVSPGGLRSASSALLVWVYARTRGVPLFRRDGALGFGALIAALFAGEFVFLYWGLAGALLLGEPVTGALALAMLFVAAGIYLVNRA